MHCRVIAPQKGSHLGLAHSPCSVTANDMRHRICRETMIERNVTIPATPFCRRRSPNMEYFLGDNTESRTLRQSGRWIECAQCSLCHQTCQRNGMAMRPACVNCPKLNHLECTCHFSKKKQLHNLNASRNPLFPGLKSTGERRFFLKHQYNH